MIRLILLLVFVVQASLELQLREYQMHVTRKSRSNVAPVESGYVYSKVNNNPGTIATFGNGANAFTNQVVEPYASLRVLNHSSDTYKKHSKNYDIPTLKFIDTNSDTLIKETTIDKAPKIDNTLKKRYGGDYSRYFSSLPKGKYDEKTINHSPPIVYSQMSPVSYTFPSKHSILAGTDVSSTITERSISPYSVDYQIAKSEAKYDSKFLPSKMKADAEFERLKANMHYRPSSDVMYDLAYSSFNNFHVDENDVRTSSRSPYDGWPYFYHNPYEFDNNKISADMSFQKAIDKRYAVDSNTNYKTIPVYEHQEYDKPYNAPYIESTTVDNPISGHQPFFSFVLNDYFDKSSDDDALNFKGVDWGREFDYGPGKPVIEDITVNHQRRPSRQDNTNTYEQHGQHLNNDQHGNTYTTHQLKLGDASTEKGYTKNHEFVKQEKGDKKGSDRKETYEQKGQDQKHFKDFLDSFVNKFGGENHKKDAKYSLQRNQDKGENKKGFRRVYHKDEYQEDNEFYDNTNKKAHVHEDAHSAGQFGGSEAFLNSHATAAIGDTSNSHNKKGNTHNSHFENNHRGNDRTHGSDYDFNRYREEAQKIARNNGADYPDYPS